jgi:hypothetical protein
MNAVLVRDFFLGKVTAPQLARNLADAFERVSKQSSRLRMQDLNEDFEVRPEHLVRLCDAVMNGSLPPPTLEAIGFGLIASDFFTWDSNTPEGWRVGQALHDWASPQVNFALTKETASKFRERLISGEDTFTRADFGSAFA